MLANRRRDTEPELAVRRQLHALGMRFRVDIAIGANRRRRVDIAFTRARLAVFIDGCFWHFCPEHRSVPKSNTEFWLSKFARNMQRDRATDEQLGDAGWLVLRVWEHEPPEEAASRIRLAYLERLLDDVAE